MLNRKASIAPTLLCADPLNLRQEISSLEKLDIKWHHVDMMDGHFVPNLAFGMDAVAAICRAAKMPVCVHLMADRPGDYVGRLADSGVSGFVFHIEAERAPFRLIGAVREAGMLCGAAISPITPIEVLGPILPHLQIVTVMGVEPGFSGQSFLPHTIGKIAALRALADHQNPSLMIEVDGGVDDLNGPQCAASGADVLVGGAFTLFKKGASLEENFTRFSQALDR